jgi:hypothetical protein
MNAYRGKTQDLGEPHDGFGDTGVMGNLVRVDINAEQDCKACKLLSIVFCMTWMVLTLRDEWEDIGERGGKNYGTQTDCQDWTSEGGSHLAVLEVGLFPRTLILDR